MTKAEFMALPVVMQVGLGASLPYGYLDATSYTDVMNGYRLGVKGYWGSFVDDGKENDAEE